MNSGTTSLTPELEFLAGCTMPQQPLESQDQTRITSRPRRELDAVPVRVGNETCTSGLPRRLSRRHALLRRNAADGKEFLPGADCTRVHGRSRVRGGWAAFGQRGPPGPRGRRDHFRRMRFGPVSGALATVGMSTSSPVPRTSLFRAASIARCRRSARTSRGGSSVRYSAT
jgi:hypothetical protein